MEKRWKKLDSWYELAKNAINTEPKASLQPTSMLREIDQRFSRRNCPAHTIGAQLLQASAI